ncbi:MAG: prepilin-type N-terminal cleavage/methylation domain-containing protein, partial [Candidatus Methylomirabilaceae bacterium]
MNKKRGRGATDEVRGATYCAPRTPPSSSPAQHGFTLLELVVVLFLLALVAALVAPGFRRPSGQLYLKAATRDLAAVCRFARTRAVIHQAVVEVVLDRRANAYWLRGPDWVISGLGGVDQVAALKQPEHPWESGVRQARVRVLPA